MKNKVYSETEILNILKEYETGVSARELGRKHGFYHETLYKWKKQYGGITSGTELRKYKELERENAQLKKMYAELSLHHSVLKQAMEKKW